MKKYLLILAAAAFVLSACNKNNPTPEPDPDEGLEVFEGEQITLPQAEGESVTVSLEFDQSWQVVGNTNDWLTVSPASGFSGVTEVTFTAAQSNTSIYERIGTFRIRTSETSTVYTVVQTAERGAEFVQAAYATDDAAGSFTLSVRANDAVSFSSDSDWLTVGEVESNVADVTLSGGIILSELKVSNVNFDIEANEGGEMREATVTMECAGKNYTATVRQLGGGEVEVSDWTTAFLRRSLVMRFTATWCGYCPYMAHQIDLAMEDYPGLIVPFNVHSSNSDIVSYNSDEFYSRYRINGLPTGLVNTVAQVNSNTAGDIVKSQIEALVLEAQSELPASTALAGQNVVAGQTLKASVAVAVRDAGDYTLHAYLMEDGVVSSQTSYTAGLGGNNYVHNAIMRCALVNPYSIDGEDFTASAKDVHTVEVEFDIPNGYVEDIDNCYVLMFVTRPLDSAFNGAVSSVQYKNFGYVVDNVAVMPVNSSVDFAYEQ